MTTATCPTLYCDLDGVVADFYGYARQVLGTDFKEVATPIAWGVLSLVPNLFQKLELLPGALELFKELEATYPNFQVLTARPLPTGFLMTAKRDKHIWVRNKVSETVIVNVCDRGVHKYKYAKPGDILIDDQLRNLIPWEEHGGVAIHHTSVESTRLKLEELGILKK